jgi:hypothetical protein
VDHCQPGARPGRGGELVRQAAEAAVQQPVQPLAGQLAGLHQRHRHRVHARRQAEVVEAAAGHHPAPDHGGGVGPARQQGEQLGLPGGDPLQGRGRQGQPLATPGDRLHHLAGQVAVAAERDQGGRSSVGAVWLG